MNKKNLRQNLIFFFDKEHAKKMRISLLMRQAVKIYILLTAPWTLANLSVSIWYGGHVPPSILNWFLEGDRVQELAPALSRVDLALQYRQDRPTSPLIPKTTCSVNKAFLYNS